jgi:predicted CoA-binding protein
VASQYVNKAQEAGTENLWAQLHARAENEEK